MLWMLKGNSMISLEHVGNFFSPTTAPNGISNGDHHCLIASSTANIYPLPHFLHWRHLLQWGVEHQSLLASTAEQLATAGEDSTRKHWSLFPKSCSTWHIFGFNLAF